MEISVSVNFCYGHRLLLHGGKCRNIHGHNATATVKYAGALNDQDMVVDFGEIKADIKAWVDYTWDHACLFNSHDTDLHAALVKLGSKKHEMRGEPTAEAMARELFRVATKKAPAGVSLASVTIQETATAMATCTSTE